MKKYQKALLILTISLTVWLWSYSKLPLFHWLAVPFTLAVMFGIYAATTILTNVFRLKNNLEARLSLDREVERARNYYLEQKISLEE